MPVPGKAWAATRAVRQVLVGFVGLALAGCGPLRPETPEPSPALVGQAEAAQALRSWIEARGLRPAAEDIADDALLFTEMIRPPGPSMELERDTIRGGSLVAGRLQFREVDSRTPFELRTERVYQCDEAVVQTGVFPLAADESERVAAAPAAAADQRVVWAPFSARWREESGGELKLEAVWLAPLGFEVRVARLAERCRDTGGIVFRRDYAGRRAGLELGVGYPLQLSATGHLEDALRDHGWDRNVASVPSVSTVLDGFYRLRPGVQLEAVAAYHFPSRVEATGDVFDATLEWTGASAAGLVMRELGPLRLGVGAAVSYTRWNWSDRVFNDVYDAGEPTSGTSLVPGGVAELGYIQTVRSRVYIHVRARYAYFTEAEVPGFRDLGALDVPMGGLRLTAGLGYWW